MPVLTRCEHHCSVPELGEAAAGMSAKHPAIQMLYSIAHTGHEVSVVEATQLYELAKTLESFLGGLAPIGRNIKR